MDIPLLAGTASTVVFAASNLPMLRKALRTGDVSSYSLVSLAMINAANLVYSAYVFTLPIGPVWALHTFYVVSCGIMLWLCLRQKRAARARGLSEALGERGVDDAAGGGDAEASTADAYPLARDSQSMHRIAVGLASSRPGAMGRPQSTHTP